ncbi:MAG: rhodanese-like domain-containing protein [Hyphomicrobium zavarzinii]|uniref:rhodanese-like domain-containing protein n=1 Tax=Hyphomicrobium zavarzinii TaxID=48292 RepID=UPI001A5A75AC|nr:rhodanese-like domain-containing protein [Hyphomicrobium zavarzinii]MBL8845153.1 rhodanese-like domain-containing protein [Hyphomicrobium zavarzinii]
MKVGYRQLLDAANSEITTLGAAEVRDLADWGEIQLVDLRDRRELEREGRIPGAFHCPRGMLEFWIDPESPYHKPVFAEPRRFVFYCASGWRSALATKAAQDMGLDPVAHLGGGFTAWREAGFPVEPVSK